MKIEFISSELLTVGSAVPLALSYPVKIEKRPTCSAQWSDGRNGLHDEQNTHHHTFVRRRAEGNDASV